MSYTGNHRIDACLLVVINDGDGSQCGRSYKERLQVAAWASRGSLWPWRLTILRAMRWNAMYGDGPLLDSNEIGQGARFLRDYYRDLLKEGA